ncbi:hypothetical protein GCM10022419_099700 [Nonomuraea rosea]|uniref:Uncharacterized protein n=1 Tax=Nonomuraea rosea TaxID=638574 RepID=A0ABP6Z8J9_9ACTN
MSGPARAMAVAMAGAVTAAALVGCAPGQADMPSVAPGGECPVTRTVTRPTALGGDMLGEGPARPVMGPVLEYTAAGPGTLFEDSGWGGAKVLWFAAPHLRDPVVIKGRRLDGDSPVAFDGTQGEPLRNEIVIPPDPAAGDWRDRPGYVRLRAPGCYAFQIDTPDESTVLVFEAVGPVQG